MKIGHQISCQNLGKHTHGDRRGHVMNERAMSSFPSGQSSPHSLRMVKREMGISPTVCLMSSRMRGHLDVPRWCFMKWPELGSPLLNQTSE